MTILDSFPPLYNLIARGPPDLDNEDWIVEINQHAT